MKFNTETIFRIFFHLGCAIATIFCTFQCYRKYRKDESSYEINYQRFHKEIEDVYPSISMCFSMPFTQEKLNRYAHGITALNYSDFIMGLEEWKEVDPNHYNDVTMQISDFLVSAVIDGRSLGKFNMNSTLSFENISVLGFNVRMNWFLNCFSINFPNQNRNLINGVLIKIKNNIFPNSTRPMDGWVTPFGLSMFYHLPNQILRSHSTRKSMWPKVSEEMKNKYSPIVYISSIEVIVRRQREYRNCLEFSNYDHMLIEEIMMEENCKPPYWNSTQDIPICKTSKDLKRISEGVWAKFFGSIPVTPPCSEIKSITFEYDDTETWAQYAIDDELLFQIFFRDASFKKIIERRDYDIQDLFGDIGGYVGLFLGYALVNIPGFFVRLKKSFKVSKMKQDVKILQRP